MNSMAEIPKWFATSPFPLDVESGGDGICKVQAALVHAKRLGTTASACGLDTTAWMKHWVSFDMVSPGRGCLACRQAVTQLDGQLPSSG
jgi:hypothetical protein